MHAVTTFPVTEAYRGMRLDRFLQQMLPRMSRASVQDAIDHRVTLASGAAPKASRRLVVGECVTIGPRPESPAAAVAVPTLAEGPGWLAVDKPAGLATTPMSRRPGADVASLLQLQPAHRLDRFTSGCLVLTRDAATARAFDLAFRAHRIGKEYIAVVHGHVRDDTFTVEAPLGLATASRVTGKIGVVANGDPASTDCEVLERGADRTLLRVRPRTGRRHQIRVHLAHIGHALVGDVLYGADEREFIRLQRGQPITPPAGLLPGRHLLHAHRLQFADPGNGQPVLVCAPWPPDLGTWRATPPTAIASA